MREVFGQVVGFLVGTYGKPAAVLVVASIVLLLAYPCYWLAERTYTLIRFQLSEDELRGSPPFRTEWEVKLTEEERREFGRETGIATKRALIRFPNPPSCLEEGIESLTPEALRRMDWERMQTASEVEVCVFRLLAASGNITHATDWFEAQGFQVPDRFSSTNPFVELDGSLRVYGAWSIRDNGPKYNKGSLLNRLLPDLAYSMEIHTYWSADGQQLQAVDVGFSSK